MLGGEVARAHVVRGRGAAHRQLLQHRVVARGERVAVTEHALVLAGVALAAPRLHAQPQLVHIGLYGGEQRVHRVQPTGRVVQPVRGQRRARRVGERDLVLQADRRHEPGLLGGA